MEIFNTSDIKKSHRLASMAFFEISLKIIQQLLDQQQKSFRYFQPIQILVFDLR